MEAEVIRRLILISAIAALGCDSLTGVEAHDNGRVPATLEHYGDEIRIEIPTTVTAGEDFTVAVFTYGGGCVSKGETESEVQGSTATIRPYDYDATATLPANSACTSDLKIYRHEATLRFMQPGTARVTVFGKRAPGNYAISATRMVEVE